MAHVPAVVHRQLDVVKHNRDGGLLLGASSLSYRYWVGSLWYFADASQAPNVEKCNAGVELECGINDAEWIDNARVFAASDTGAVELWQLDEERSKFNCFFQYPAHEDVVSSVSVFHTKDKALSGSNDRSIKIWDLEETLCTHTYKAHREMVTQVVCHPSEPLFASCSYDGAVLIWDTRKSKPATSLATGCAGPAHCVSWHPDQPHTLAIGDQLGNITVTDTRHGVDHLHQFQPHTRLVHRIAFCPAKTSLLASISEDSTVVVSELSEKTPNIVMRDTSHSDFVRGLSWCPESGRLVTCGWDFKVLSHTVPGSGPVKMEVTGAVENNVKEPSNSKPPKVNGVKTDKVDSEKMDTSPAASYSDKLKSVPVGS